MDSLNERLNHLAKLIRTSTPPESAVTEYRGRNILTRQLDVAFAFLREHLTSVHWVLVVVSSALLFLYVQLVARTSRLAVSGSQRWPNISVPSVVALWHRDAPSLLVAFAKHRPPSNCTILISSDPRGDYLAMLCRMVGFRVVRGGSEEHGWDALRRLGLELTSRGCVFITADGGGPARTAKVGAVALASAAAVPLIPLCADCHPAIEERHKWDRARNPVPFCRLTILIGETRAPEIFADCAAVEETTGWLEASLNELTGQTRGWSET